MGILNAHVYREGNTPGVCEDCCLSQPSPIHQAAKPTNPKDAIGSTKPPLSTIPTRVLFLLGLGMLEGTCKYGRHNYRAAGVRGSVYFDAALRHMSKWYEGEDIDPDSGLPHVIKAMASLAVLMDGILEGNFNDDRPPKIDPKFWNEVEKKAKEILARFPNPVEPFTELGRT